MASRSHEPLKHSYPSIQPTQVFLLCDPLSSAVNHHRWFCFCSAPDAGEAAAPGTTTAVFALLLAPRCRQLLRPSNASSGPCDRRWASSRAGHPAATGAAVVVDEEALLQHLVLPVVEAGGVPHRLLLRAANVLEPAGGEVATGRHPCWNCRAAIYAGTNDNPCCNRPAILLETTSVTATIGHTTCWNQPRPRCEGVFFFARSSVFFCWNLVKLFLQSTTGSSFLLSCFAGTGV